jgi:cellulose biosynthesis protein BcsQ
VLVPITPSEFALDGFKYLVNGIGSFTRLNPGMRILGTFRSKWEKASYQSTIRIEEQLKLLDEGFLLDTTVPNAIAIENAVAERIPVNYTKKYKNSSVSLAFKELTTEILKRWDGKIIRLMAM